MSEQYVIDLGSDYGSIIMVPAAAPVIPEETGVVPVSRVQDAVKTINVRVQEALMKPLRGIGEALQAAIPDETALDTDLFALDEFSVEFQLGLSAAAGVNAGPTATISPNGSFKCAYKWKRRPSNDNGV